MLPWQPFLAFYIWGAHWRHLKNTTEPSLCGGDAALCQVTLTTCFIETWPSSCRSEWNELITSIQSRICSLTKRYLQWPHQQTHRMADCTHIYQPRRKTSWQNASTQNQRPVTDGISRRV